MRITALGYLDELVYDVLRGRLIGVSHAKINDIFAAPTRRKL